MKKAVKIISLFVMVAVFAGFATIAFADNIVMEMGVSVFINEEKLEFDVEPFITDGRTMVPMRKIFESLGATVEWDNDLEKASSEKGDRKVSIKINEKKLYVDKNIVDLDVPAMLVNDRTMVPVRAISEAFDCLVKWDNTKKEVHIYTEEIIVNVKDFGAKGDGISNDRSAIERAFKHAIENLPAAVYFPEGTYGLSRGGIYIKMPLGSGGLTVIGDGAEKSTIKYLADWRSDGSWVAIRISPEITPRDESQYLHDITFSDLGVYDSEPLIHAWVAGKNKATEETHGFDLQYTIRGTYRNLKIENVGDEGLDMVYCIDSNIHDNIVIGSPGAGGSGGAISVGDGCRNVVVENNIIEGTVEGKTNFGIAIESLFEDTVIKNVEIRNNKISKINGNGINIGAPSGTITDVKIHNNIIDESPVAIKFMGIGKKENITITNTEIKNVNTAIETKNSKNNTNILIDNFKIAGAKDIAIKIIGSKNVVISNGEITNCEKAVIQNSAQNSMFKNIVIDGVGKLGETENVGAIYQINYTDSTVSDVIIKNCYFPVAISKIDKVYNTIIEQTGNNTGEISIRNAKEIKGGELNRGIDVYENNTVVEGVKIKTDYDFGKKAAIYLSNVTGCTVENCEIDIPENSKAILQAGKSENNTIVNNIVK